MTQDPLPSLAASLTEAARKLIPHMSNGEWVQPVANIARDAELPIDAARKAMRELRAAGLAEWGPLWNEDECRPNGSGTWLSTSGLALRAHLQERGS